MLRKCVHARRTIVSAAAGLMIAAGGAIAQQDMGVPGLAGQPEPNTKLGPAPLSKTHGVQFVAPVPRLTLVPLTPDRLMTLAMEDEASPGPLRVSVGREVEFDWRLGQEFMAPDGSRVWALDLELADAFGVRPRLALNLPPGAQATVYAPDAPGSAPWPYEGQGPFDDGTLWARTAYGSVARIEVYLPAGVIVDPADPPLRILAAQHVYRDPDTGLVGRSGQPEEMSCHNDSSCYAAYNTMRRGAARMYFIEGGSGFVCSGQFLNALNGDLTPYFLSANHCISTQAVANTLETYWLYQTASCNGAIPSLASASRADVGTLLSTATPSDFVFLMIEGTVRRDLYWQGWSTAMPAFNESMFGVHHPDGSWKRVSVGVNSGLPPFITPPCGDLSNHLRISWSSGTTEGGSSGSGVYRTFAVGDYRLVAQSHCSRLPRTCPGTNPESDKGYGRFDITYPNIQALLAGGSDDAFEPNDTCGAARFMGGVQNTSNAGLIVKSTSEDWYAFDVPAGGSATFTTTFTHANGDIDLHLYSACGGTLVDSSTGVSGSEQVDVVNTSGGTIRYYLRVYLYNDTRNSYTLQRIVRNPAVPANNNCTSYYNVTLGGPSLNGTTLGATNDGSASCGSSTTSPDVWYSFLSDCAGSATIDTLGSAFDTVLSVHTACPGTTANQVACNDDFNPPERWSRVTFTTAANTRYYVRVAGFNGATGNFVLNSSRPAVSFDRCAAPGTATNGTMTFSTCGATTDGEPDALCNAFGFNQIDNDVWYNYVATCNGVVTADTFGSNFDTKLAAYLTPRPGPCPLPDSAIACNDDANGTLQSQVQFPVTSGTTYLLRVGGYRNAAGSARLTIACTPLCPGQGAGACSPADLDENGVIDFNDFLAFLNLFNAQDLCVDFDGSSAIDFNDFLAFLNLYNAGC